MEFNMENIEEEKLLKIGDHMMQIMMLLGVPINDSTIDTPRRIAKMYVNEVFSSLKPDSIEELRSKMKTFDAPITIGSKSEMVIMKDIPFYSMCEHHFMPFFGKVSVGYVPNDKIIGLSKIPRIVKHMSKYPQVQERLGDWIAEFLVEVLDPKMVVVKIHDTTHTCCTARGIESEGSTNTIHIISNVGEKDHDYYMTHFRNEVK